MSDSKSQNEAKRDEIRYPPVCNTSIALLFDNNFLFPKVSRGQIHRSVDQIFRI